MSTELGGYRQYKKTTATATTLNQDLPAIGDGHKVYVERVALKSSKGNADAVICIVSGGQEYPVQNHLNFTADHTEGQVMNFWLYTGEFLRAKWSDIASADILEFWGIGVDKWVVDGGEGN